MRRSLPLASAFAAVFWLSAEAQADRVTLSGGTVLEGKVTRTGDRVAIEVEAGTITVPSSSVVKVEKQETAVERVAARYAALKPKDVASRVLLSDYCRDHGMRGRERELLSEVLEIDPENATARSRLGYVKTPTGWVTEADAMRAKGLVMRDGRWVPEGEARALDRADHDAALVATRRAEQDEMDAERRRVDRDRADLEAERERLKANRRTTLFATPPFTYFTPVYRYGVTPFVDDCPWGRGCRRSVPRPAPVDTSLSVVKVPYSH